MTQKKKKVLELHMLKDYLTLEEIHYNLTINKPMYLPNTLQAVTLLEFDFLNKLQIFHLLQGYKKNQLKCEPLVLMLEALLSCIGS